MAKIQQAELTDFVPDQKNANRGTKRGRKMVEDSLVEDGAARSVVVDKNNNIVAGNKTLEAAARVGIDKALVVEVGGDQLIITKRTDWDLYADEAPRRYAYRDNRSVELSLDWDLEQLLTDVGDGLDLSNLFADNELAEIEEEALLASELAASLVGGTPAAGGGGDKKKQIKPVLYTEQIGVFEAAIKEVGIRNRGQALIEICKEYLEKRQLDL